MLEQYKQWLDKPALQVPPKSEIGSAIGYSLNQWHKLSRYIDDGQLAIDNNMAERAIYTTNTIDSLNSVIRKIINKRKIFPHDDSAMKIIYLAVEQASKRWTMSIRNWKAALNRFMIEFEDRLIDHI